MRASSAGPALCGNAALAEELAQDTLVEAWKCLRRYHGRCEFFTWLCAILLNRYRNSIRNHHLRPVSTLGSRERDEFTNAVEKLTDHGVLPDQAAELREQGALVRKCLASLPAIAVLLSALFAVVAPRHRPPPSLPVPPAVPVVSASGSGSDLAPTLANYQLIASQSLEEVASKALERALRP